MSRTKVGWVARVIRYALHHHFLPQSKQSAAHQARFHSTKQTMSSSAADRKCYRSQSTMLLFVAPAP